MRGRRLLSFAPVLLAAQAIAQASLLYVADNTKSTVATYDSSTGSAINGSFLSVPNPIDIAIEGDYLYVLTANGKVGRFDATTGVGNSSFLTSVFANAIDTYGNTLYLDFGGKIGTYDAATGALLNANFITGLNNSFHLAIDGGALYLTDEGAGTVGVYNASTGAAINPSLVSGLVSPDAFAISGNTLYVESGSHGHQPSTPAGPFKIGTYNATTGASIAASLWTSSSTNPAAIEVLGNDLLVSMGSSIDRHNATTGSLITPSFISGGFGKIVALDVPSASTPEPSTWNAMVVGGLALACLFRRGRTSSRQP